MNSKRCNRCKEILPLSDFYPSGGIAGAYPRCKSCTRYINLINYQKRTIRRLQGHKLQAEDVSRIPLLDANREALKALIENFKNKDSVAAPTQLVGAVERIHNGVTLVRAQEQAFIEIVTGQYRPISRNLSFTTIEDLSEHLTSLNLKLLYPQPETFSGVHHEKL